MFSFLIKCEGRRNKQDLGMLSNPVGEDIPNGAGFYFSRFPPSTDRLLIYLSPCCCFGVGLCQTEAQIGLFDLGGKKGN